MERLLKAKRVLNGINQLEFAKMLGMNNSTYSLKENGRKDFTQTEIKKIIDYFNLTPEETITIFFAN